MHFKAGDQVELSIDGMGASGEGVGSIDGFKVFIEEALPGETVHAELTQVKATYAKGQSLKVIKASPDRVQPVCPLFGNCGGCQVMHLQYEAQLQIKTQKVYDALTRIGGLESPEVRPCIGSPSPLAYRNKIQLPVRNDKEGLTLGLYTRRSHDIVPVDHCYIHCDVGEEVYSVVKAELRKSGVRAYDSADKSGELRHVLIKSAYNQGKALLVLVTNGRGRRKLEEFAERVLKSCPQLEGVVENINRRHDNVILGREYRPLAGKNSISETILGLEFKVSPAAFFQVNTPQAEALYAYAIEQANIVGTDHVVDAYCGVGGLALIAARSANRVTGIECVQDAISDAEENATKNGISNAKFTCGLAEKILPKLKDVDCLLLNPPRKGCDPEVIAAASQLAPNRIVYISCNPATLARDLRLLDGYTIQSIQPFDMFPQTTHVETVVVLQR